MNNNVQQQCYFWQVISSFQTAAIVSTRMPTIDSHANSRRTVGAEKVESDESEKLAAALASCAALPPASLRAIARAVARGEPLLGAIAAEKEVPAPSAFTDALDWNQRFQRSVEALQVCLMFLMFLMFLIFYVFNVLNVLNVLNV